MLCDYDIKLRYRFVVNQVTERASSQEKRGKGVVLAHSGGPHVPTAGRAKTSRRQFGCRRLGLSIHHRIAHLHFIIAQNSPCHHCKPTIVLGCVLTCVDEIFTKEGCLNISLVTSRLILRVAEPLETSAIASLHRRSFQRQPALLVG